MLTTAGTLGGGMAPVLCHQLHSCQVWAHRAGIGGETLGTVKGAATERMGAAFCEVIRREWEH